jgi:tRNA modification GTPase
MNNVYTQNDTIAAISTPLGTGGVGIVRISGVDSEKIISEIFSVTLKNKKLPDFEANRIYHGWITGAEVQNGCGQQTMKDCNSFSSPIHIIDEVIVLCFKAPKSYTGEDLFEIQCHGGINVVKNILKLCLKAGARLAERGEFSKRAFVNGKLDLSKAEAVLDLIHSKTDKFSQAAAGNLSGNLSKYINALRAELLELLSLITAAIDFPEEVAEPEYTFIEEKLNGFILRIDNVLKTANSSNLMRDGLKVALAGKPNVGKSSLFNALLDMERAIVTEFSGTTRDIIHESFDIDGIPVILSDTAGIRELNIENSADYIESIGVNNSKSCIDSADVVLFVYDSSQGLLEEDKIIFEQIKDKQVVFVGSKSDLARKNIPLVENSLLISAKEKTGLDSIKEAIKKLIVTEDVSEGFCTNTRQQEALNISKKSLKQALDACQNNEIQDLISIDLKSAVISLGEITGEVVSDEIINNIFDNFCIGK